jgi:tetratricopeptide (TPR) repeat protein
LSHPPPFDIIPPPQQVPPDLDQALAQANALWNAGQAQQAEALCQRILTFVPGQPDALHLLGLMAHAYGLPDLAIAHLRAACQAPRAPALYFSNLAEMCRQRGLLEEGEAAGRRAIALEPRLEGAWNNLGILLQEQGKLEESRTCLQRVLQMQPNNAQAHNNLGNTCKHLGLLDEAERRWARAVELQPNYPEPFSNLANLLTDQGEYDRAEAMGRKAIELNPRLADAYLNLAGVETARQRHAEALRWLQALLGFAPEHVGGLAALAMTLKELDRVPEALEAARHAVAAGPANAEAYHALGLALQSSDHFDEALEAYGRAATLPGIAREKAMISQAVLHMELGRSEQAQKAFAAVTEVYPTSAKAWFNQADMRRFKPGDPAIERMRTLLAPDGSQSRSDQMLLHFALGKAFLDIGDSALAFEHIDTGNRMKRETINYDPVATSQWLASIAEVFTPDFLAAKAPQDAPRGTPDRGTPDRGVAVGSGAVGPGAVGPDAIDEGNMASGAVGEGNAAGGDMPIFVLGMPRSGTTLVEQILASHPAIHGAGELRHMQKIVDEIGDFPRAVAGMTPDRLRAFGVWYRGRVAPLARGRRHVVDKMPSNFMYAGLIRLILPGARIIHCRRDPVDTCLSCYSKLFAGEQAFSYDQTEVGRFHRDYQALVAHWRAVLPASHFLEVDYEAVVADVEAEARRMLDFLGLPWDPACLEFHRTERVVLTASVNQVRQPIYRTSSGRWRAHAAHLQPLLAALGLAEG